MTREEMIAEIERQQGVISMTKFKCDDCGEEIWYRKFSKKNDTFECKCKSVVVAEILIEKEDKDEQQDS